VAATQLALNLESTGQGIDGNESKRRSRIKTLKKRLHRAEQRPAEGVSVLEVDCPYCGARGLPTRTNGPQLNRCRPPGGGYLPPYYHHKERKEVSRRLMQEIQDAAKAARDELETLL
jgi:hypothetical protein